MSSPTIHFTCSVQHAADAAMLAVLECISSMGDTAHGPGKLDTSMLTLSLLERVQTGGCSSSSNPAHQHLYKTLATSPECERCVALLQLCCHAERVRLASQVEVVAHRVYRMAAAKLLEAVLYIVTDGRWNDSSYSWKAASAMEMLLTPDAVRCVHSS